MLDFHFSAKLSTINTHFVSFLLFTLIVFNVPSGQHNLHSARFCFFLIGLIIRGHGGLSEIIEKSINIFDYYIERNELFSLIYFIIDYCKMLPPSEIGFFWITQ